MDGGAVGATVVDGGGGGSGEGLLLLLWLVAKYSQRLLYVILRRSGTQKNKGEISPPLREISRVFLGKGKKSIDLERVVRNFALKFTGAGNLLRLPTSGTAQLQ